MAPSLVKLVLFALLGSLTSATPNINSQVHKRDLLLANSSTLPGKWQSYGCYLDGTTNGRSLAGASYVNGTTMTQESCVSYCDSQGYYYAGVEYGDECYCGNLLYPSTPEPNTDCQVPCAGNSSEACGGGNRLNVFWSGKTPPTTPVTNYGPPGWTLLGCYMEGTTGRTLRTGIPVTGGSNQMTVAACTYACSAAGFTYAGVEYAQECYCDTAISNGGALSPNGLADCNKVCTGNSSEFCGNGNRLDLYELTSLITTSSSTVVSTTTTSTSTTPSSSTTTTSSTSTTTSSSSSSSTTTSASSSTTTTSPSSSSTTSSTSSSTTTTTSSSSSSTTTTSPTSSSTTTTSPTSSSTTSSTSSGTTTTASSTSSTTTTTSSSTSSSKSSTTTSSSSSTTPSTTTTSTSTTKSTSSSSTTSTTASTTKSTTTSTSTTKPTSTTTSTSKSTTTSSTSSSKSTTPSTTSSKSTTTSSTTSSKSTTTSTTSPTTSIKSTTTSTTSSKSTTTSSSTTSSKSTTSTTSSASSTTSSATSSSTSSSSTTSSLTTSSSPTSSSTTSSSTTSSSTTSSSTTSSSTTSSSTTSSSTTSSSTTSSSTTSSSTTSSSPTSSSTTSSSTTSSSTTFSSTTSSSPTSSSTTSSLATSSSTTSSSTTSSSTTSSSTTSSSTTSSSTTSSSTTSSSTTSSSTTSSSTTSSSPTSSSTTSSLTTSSSTTSSSTTLSSTTSSSTTSSSTTSSSTTSTSSTSSSTSVTSTSSTSTSSTSTTSSTPTPTPTGPVHVQSVGGYAWIGCFTEATNSRALNGAAYVNYTSMTVEICQAFCSSPVAYQYFGVEFSGECYCGNALQTGSIGAPMNDCGMICDGSPYEFCGSGNRLDVYSLGGTSPAPVSSNTATTTSASATTTSAVPTSIPSGWTYAGCYIDGVNGRILRDGIPDSQTNTVESCVNYCASNGYTIAGMEFSTQCFCDTAIYNGGVLSTNPGDCNMACAGNSAEICGSGGRLSIYNIGTLTTYQAPVVQTGGLGNWTYRGCYTDNVNDNRALFWQIILTNNNTATNCLGLCQEYGYMSAGMEYGDECYCGDKSNLVASGSTLRPDTECTVPCSGNATAICGDGNRLSYYEYTAAPLYKWATPSGNLSGLYEFFVPGVVVPLMTSLAINNKVTFLEKHGTGAPNTTGAYELDLSLSNNFNLMWREMHLQTDVFCSGGLTLPDKGGRQLTVGGWAGSSTFGVRLYWPNGSAGVNGTHDWQENVNELTLQTGRWYPSNMMMSNGSILVTGGEIGSNSAGNPTLEILPQPAGGYVKYLDWLARTGPNNLYPFMFVMPKTGAIFAAYYNEARLLDPGTLDTTTVLPNIPGSVSNFLAGRTYPLEGTAVMLPLSAPYTADAVMLICGGSANGAALAIDNCVSIAPESTNPQWTIERMPSQRVMTCITALPDGTYLILNGAQEGVAGFGLATNPNLGAVLYDPSQPVGFRMSIMANTIVPRLYHSEAILLPDGSVLVSGSDPQDGVHNEEYRIEKFLLPYNLNGMAPPSFSIVSTDWQYAFSYPITITSLPTGNYNTMKVSLIAAVSSTHGNSMGQKTIFPAFSISGNTVTITAPPNNKISPPGWFQLFVLDNGTPSFSTWVRIGGDPAQLGNWPNFPDFTVPGI